MDKEGITGVVIRATSGFYFVKSGMKIVSCKVRGRMKQSRYSVCVGDNVLFTAAGENSGTIEEVLPRESFLKRPEVANVNQAILTFAANQPQLDFGLLDRFLVLAELSEIAPIICVNKIDMADTEELSPFLAVYEKIGYPVLQVSAKMGIGMQSLQKVLYDKVSVFAGPSGVGKSSLLNAIEPGLRLVTGELSLKIGRGKHTTRCAELLPLSGGGFVVDTPGFSFTEFIEMAPEDLRFQYRDFKAHLADCHFSSCLHYREPQCAVKQAVKSEQIAAWRYESYLELLLEILQTQQKRRF
jgi:ribosome biogenesis GTPase